MIREWSEILDQYESYGEKDPAIDGVRNLVAYIVGGKLSTVLYAWTSMFDLCIVQTEIQYPYNGPCLRISPLSGGIIEFRYIDTAIASRQWHREVMPEEAISRLHGFLSQLHWVTTLA